LAVLTDAYLSSLRAPLGIADDVLTRWQAIQAAARMSEGVPRAALFAVWTAFEAGEPSVHAAAN
jgi:hypothetical protein